MKIFDAEVVVGRGQLCDQDTDAIVVSLKQDFSMDRGAARVIREKAGPVFEKEMLKTKFSTTNKVLVVSGGDLPAKQVICVVVEGSGQDVDMAVRSATALVLQKAEAGKLRSLAFSALVSGDEGLSYKDCAKIMAQEVFRYLREVKVPCLRRIDFVLDSDQALEVFKKNVESYLGHLTKKTNQGPFLTVDGIVEYEGGIVMVERMNPPLGWALPGGFVDYGESVEESVVREVKEETSLDFFNHVQFKTYSDPSRDPRFHTVSVVFVGKGRGVLQAASDAMNAAVFTLDGLPDKIPFDHRQVIEDYIRETKRRAKP